MCHFDGPQWERRRCWAPIGESLGPLDLQGDNMKKTLIAALICSASVVGVSAGSAFAGEVTGNGKGTPLPSHGPYAPATEVNDDIVVMPSLCAYSGQNDEYQKDPNGDWARTQTPADAPPGSPGHDPEHNCKGSGGGRVFED